MYQSDVTFEADVCKSSFDLCWDGEEWDQYLFNCGYGTGLRIFEPEHFSNSTKDTLVKYGCHFTRSLPKHSANDNARMSN